MSEREKPELSLPLNQYLEDPPADLEDAVWAKLCARRERPASPAPGAGAVGAPLGSRAEPRASTVEPVGDAAHVLPLPLGNVLVEGDEMAPERARLWRAVRARVRRPRTRRLPRRAALLVAATLGAAAACVLIVLTWRPSEPLAGRDRSQPQLAGALVAADGRPLGLLQAEATAKTVRLSDASEIRLDRGARVEPVLSTGSRFELLLARGTAEFSVTPGGPRRWSIDAGVARVEVVGTVFRVARLAGRVDVEVSHGVVLVIGEGVPGRVRKLTAGQKLSVTQPEASAARRAAGVPAALEPTAAAVQSASSNAGVAEAELAPGVSGSEGALVNEPRPVLLERGTARFDGPRALVGRRRTGRSEAATDADSPQQRYAQLGPAGVARETMKATSIEQLLELADVARLSGHPQDAVAPLTRALDAFRGSRQAALAAFTLGRVLLDQLGVAEPAAEAFERAIVLGLPRALRADCYRRLAEAYGRAGNEAERARAEARFQTEFALPSGSLDKVAP
jgi:transmembrane sensor